MRHTEQKYARERVDNILCDKLAKIKGSLPIIKAKKMTYQEAVRLIISGDIKLKQKVRNKELRNYDDFSDIFDVGKHHDYRGEDAFDPKLYDSKALPIKQEAQRIKDQIMLGDSIEALRMIEAFAKM